jgi:nitrogen regulatory protein PII
MPVKKIVAIIKPFKFEEVMELCKRPASKASP